jgi:hypothetical protein
MGWDTKAGRVSRAYNEWALIEHDQRAFLGVGIRFARAQYDLLWDETGNEPGDPDGPDQVDSFDKKIDGLWPHDYEWMHAAGVLRDAVTNFEVYLEKAREEVLQHQGYTHTVPERTPAWRTLKRFFDDLGVGAVIETVRDVRDLRHFLTHRRGELRTEALREQFAAHPTDMWPINVELDEQRVLAMMDVLAAAVGSIDPVVYEHSWGRRTSSQPP